MRAVDGILAGARPGLIVIETSTANPASTEALAAELAARGGYFVDAPLGGTPVQAQAGQLSALVGCDAAVLDKISGAVKKTLEDPAVRKRIEDTGSLIVANTPEQFTAQIAAEFEIYKKVVALQKLTLE